MKIGLLGGTFNPFHIGHSKLLQTALREIGLDAVVVMPAGIPYHKKDQTVAPAAYRYELCKKSVRKSVDIILSDMEVRRDKASYTIDTINALQLLMPTVEEFYLIYGSDVLYTIHKWKEPEQLMRRAVLLVALRPEDDLEEVRTQADALKHSYGADIRLLLAPQEAVSSTKIRRSIQYQQRSLYQERLELLRQFLQKRPDLDETIPDAEYWQTNEGGQPIDWRDWVSPRARSFIRENELYLKEILLCALRPETQDKLLDIERTLLTLISRKRLIHSWNTLYVAVEMALRFDVDPDKIALASLLHDAAKELTMDEMLKLAPEQSENRIKNAAVIHGPAAAVLAKRLFSVDDEEIATAIYYHTTLRENATPIEKILFVADKIEPGRTYRFLAPLRTLAKTNLNAAAFACLKDVENYLLRERLKPHPLSIAALISLAEEVKQPEVQSLLPAKFVKNNGRKNGKKNKN